MKACWGGLHRLVLVMASSTPSVCSVAMPSEETAAAVVAALAAAGRLQNDDACGDWILALGSNGLELQVFNALTALSYVVAGLRLAASADTAITRVYGVF